MYYNFPTNVELVSFMVTIISKIYGEPHMLCDKFEYLISSVKKDIENLRVTGTGKNNNLLTICYRLQSI